MWVCDPVCHKNFYHISLIWNCIFFHCLSAFKCISQFLHLNYSFLSSINNFNSFSLTKSAISNVHQRILSLFRFFNYCLNIIMSYMIGCFFSSFPSCCWVSILNAIFAYVTAEPEIFFSLYFFKSFYKGLNKPIHL